MFYFSDSKRFFIILNLKYRYQFFNFRFMNIQLEKRFMNIEFYLENKSLVLFKKKLEFYKSLKENFKEIAKMKNFEFSDFETFLKKGFKIQLI